MARHTLTTIVPCSDLDASEAFYRRLGFERSASDPDYRILNDGKGADLHLRRAGEDEMAPGRNPCGMYFYTENVDELASRLAPLLIQSAGHRPWGMYEFALSDPDGALVRVGWPTGQVPKP